MTGIRKAAIAIAGMIFCSIASAQVQRTFVASYGSDTNTATNCGFASPCRGFTAAQSVTNSGGEIVALDAAGYGAVAITKSISIIADPGFYAGISASTGNAVTIATASVNVRLSGLKINGIGANNGISMTNGASLTIDNCTISGFSNNGVDINTGAKVRMVDSLVMNNGNGGLVVRKNAVATVFNSQFLGNGNVGVWALENSTAGTSPTISVTDSIAAGNTYGYIAQTTVASTPKISVSNSSADDNGTGLGVAISGGGNAVLVVGSTKVTHNITGITDFGLGGTMRSAGNNLVNDNGANVSGTLTNIGTM